MLQGYERKAEPTGFSFLIHGYLNVSVSGMNALVSLHHFIPLPTFMLPTNLKAGQSSASFVDYVYSVNNTREEFICVAACSLQFA